MKKIELLAPAGNMEKLQVALAYGADAVYLGGKFFGLRAFSDNFTDDEIRTAVELTHSFGKKLYVTVNIFPRSDEIDRLPTYLRFLSASKVDGLLVADLGVFRSARKIIPEMPLHVSTQANTVNWAAALAWQEMGAKRVVLGREASLADIHRIRKETDLELESFIHGAMCISYSGRCLMSAYISNRSANRGECTHPCRWKYSLVEETRPGEYFPVIEDEYGTYILSSRDLCLIGQIPELADAGISCFKIEGRMKSSHYLATVVQVYRAALDAYANAPDKFEVSTSWLDELGKISDRGFTTGFFDGRPDASGQTYTGSADNIQDFAGIVQYYDETDQMAGIEQRNRLKIGDTIEVLRPGSPIFTQKVSLLTDMEGVAIASTPHPRQMYRMKLEQPVVELALIRIRRNEKPPTAK